MDDLERQAREQCEAQGIDPDARSDVGQSPSGLGLPMRMRVVRGDDPRGIQPEHLVVFAPGITGTVEENTAPLG